jgi:hypothetical protein
MLAGYSITSIQCIVTISAGANVASDKAGRCCHQLWLASSWKVAQSIEHYDPTFAQPKWDLRHLAALIVA